MHTAQCNGVPAIMLQALASVASISYESVKLLYIYDRARDLVTRFPAVSSRGLAVANEFDEETAVSGRLLQTTNTLITGSRGV